jgi:hypothetical protein
MSKPKGGTLSKLFEVSEQERRDFYENIQKKLAISDFPAPATSQEAAQTPFPLAPEQRGTPKTGIPLSGVPVLGIPETGAPERGTPNPGTPVSRTPLRKLNIRRAENVQAGHSLGEHLVLTTLWNNAAVVDKCLFRRITIGYRNLSGLCGLTVNNCKANLKSLQFKLAIEPEAGYSSTAATTYRVFHFGEILRRREIAGMTHVLRSRGSLFVHAESGIPVSGTPPIPVPGAPDCETGIPVSGEKGIPASGTHLRTKKEEDSKEVSIGAGDSVLAVSSAMRKYITIDDVAVLRIIESCRQQDPGATDEEVAHFSEVFIVQNRKNTSIRKLVAVMMSSVCSFFIPGSGELAEYRAFKTQEHAERERAAREVREIDLSDPEYAFVEGMVG